MNWVKCDHRLHYSIPSWWNCKVQNNRDLDESSEIPPVEEMDEEEISESPKDSGRDTTGHYEMDPNLVVALVYGFGNQVIELTTLLSTCPSYMKYPDPLARVEKPKRKKYACLEMEGTYEHPGTECLYFTQDLWGRIGQDNEVIKDRFIRMQMMKDAQSGRMNPQAKSGLNTN